VEEFTRRSGDFNVGGSTGRPLVTAYREEALRVANYLHQNGPSTVKEIREAASSPKAAPSCSEITTAGLSGSLGACTTYLRLGRRLSSSTAM